MRRAVLALLAACIAAPAGSQVLLPCEGTRARGDALMGPHRVRVFDGTGVMLMVMDDVEPGSGWAYLLVRYYPAGAMGTACIMVGREARGPSGFAGILWEEMTHALEPGGALRISVPMTVPPGPDAAPGAPFQPVPVTIVIDEAAGEVTLP